MFPILSRSLPSLLCHPLLQQWRECFPGSMDLDAIYKVLQACNFEGVKFQVSITHFWNMVGISFCSHDVFWAFHLLDEFECRFPYSRTSDIPHTTASPQPLSSSTFMPSLLILKSNCEQPPYCVAKVWPSFGSPKNHDH